MFDDNMRCCFKNDRFCSSFPAGNASACEHTTRICFLCLRVHWTTAWTNEAGVVVMSSVPTNWWSPTYRSGSRACLQFIDSLSLLIRVAETNRYALKVIGRHYQLVFSFCIFAACVSVAVMWLLVRLFAMLESVKPHWEPFFDPL